MSDSLVATADRASMCSANKSRALKSNFGERESKIFNAFSPKAIIK